MNAGTTEAYGLYRMIRAECSVEELRELIAVPPHIERVLRADAKAHVEDAHWIGACLKFRQVVAEEFERLLRAGVGAKDLPEVDDGEPDPVEQGRMVLGSGAFCVPNYAEKADLTRISTLF